MLSNRESVTHDDDLIVTATQYYEHIEEMEWAIEVCKEFNKPVAASMCIGPEGDLHGVSAGECAVRMSKAGADVGKTQLVLIHSLIHSLKQLKRK